LAHQITKYADNKRFAAKMVILRSLRDKRVDDNGIIAESFR